ncbi:MAG: EamA family transporter [Alphaproteobacteria bacterium]
MLNTWYVLAMVSGAGLAARNLLFKHVNHKLDAAFAALVLALAMTLVSVLYYMYQRTSTGQSMMSFNTDPASITLAAIAGAGVAFANITLALAYKAGGYASLTALLQNGFALTVTIVLGAALLGEFIKPMQFLGIALVFGGIVLITKG